MHEGGKKQRGTREATSMPQSIGPPSWLSPKGVLGMKGVFGMDKWGGQSSAWIKEGDVADTAHRSPSCTEATNEGGKDHEVPIVVGSL